MNKHIQKITINSDTGIFISNILLDTNEIEYYVMKGNEIISPKKKVKVGFNNEDVNFDGIQINKQYLIQLMTERDYTIDEMETMFNNNS